MEQGLRHYRRSTLIRFSVFLRSQKRIVFHLPFLFDIVSDILNQKADAVPTHFLGFRMEVEVFVLDSRYLDLEDINPWPGRRLKRVGIPGSCDVHRRPSPAFRGLSGL